MSKINYQALRERYSPQPVPKCHICGAEMTIQRMSASRIVYGCTGAAYDDKGCHYAEGRSIADEHYAQSRVTIVDFSDPEVLMLLDELEDKDKRIAELEDENEYIRNRFKEVDRMFGKNILVMQASIIEWRETGNAKNALEWIYNTLWGPGELPSEDEKDAQAYFNREYAPIDKELMELHRWFYERHKREKAKRASGISVKENEHG